MRLEHLLSGDEYLLSSIIEEGDTRETEYCLHYQESLVTSSLTYCEVEEKKIETRKRIKGAWGIPRLSEAMKDVISCDKLRGSAHMT